MSFARMANYFKQTILMIALSGLAFSTPPALLTAASYAYFRISDVILPGVRVGSVEVGGLKWDEAQSAIDRVYNQETKLRLIEVPSAESSWQARPEQFGLRVDAHASASSAHELGRMRGYFERVLEMLLILREGKEIQPKVIFEPERASRTLTSWSEILHRDPVDAWVQLSGAEVEVYPAKPGLQLDANRTLKELKDSHKLIYLEHGWLPLYTNQTQAQRVDVDQAVASLDDLLSSPVATHAYDPVTDERFIWQADKELIARWISLEDLGDQIEIEINTEFIQEYVDELNSSLGSERHIEKDRVVDTIIGDLTSSAEESVLHIVSYYPGEYIVRPGDTLISIGFELQMPYWKLLELNPTLSTNGLSNGQILKVPPRDDLLTLPVNPEKRIVISIREQRMRVYEHGDLKWEHIISTGIPDSPTLPGIFQISSHYENAYASIWDLYMPHFMGIYDAVPGLTNGIHGLPVLSNGQRLWTNVLGSPASYGCIILDLEAAEELFYWAEEGIVVEIQD